MQWLLMLAAVYAVLVLAVFFFQGRLIFVGAGWGRGEPLPRLQGVSIERLPLPTDRAGSFRIAWSHPQEEPPRGVMLYFLGNGEDLRSGVRWAAQWAEYGLHALVVEYPGYGESDGVVGAVSILAAAEVAAAEAAARAQEKGLPLFAGGSSLGTFSAVHVAARDASIEGLVLSAPPTSMVAMARRSFPWLPVALLLRHRFDNLALAPRVQCRVLVIHGDRDRVVPQEMGRALTESFAGSAEFVDAEHFGHMIQLDRGGAFGARVHAFLFGR